MSIVLKAHARTETQNKVKKLRLESKIPAVLYGHGFKNQNITLNYVDFDKAYNQAKGELVDLVIDEGRPIKVLIQDFQLDPLSTRFVHADLRQVNLTEKIKTDVGLNFVGESPAVKSLGGIFLKTASKIEIECLPQDLVKEINVDISSLKAFGEVIHISDLKIPAGIKVLSHAEDVIATVTPPRVEEEATTAAVAGAPDLSQIKTEAELKKEKKAADESADAETKEK